MLCVGTLQSDDLRPNFLFAPEIGPFALTLVDHRPPAWPGDAALRGTASRNGCDRLDGSVPGDWSRGAGVG